MRFRTLPAEGEPMRTKALTTGLASTLVLLVAPSTRAQPCEPALTNGSFETEDPIFPGFPEGWADVPLFGPRWRELGDNFPNPPIVRTDSHSIELPTLPNQRFVGFTTNLFDEFGELYDPAYEYGAGPLIVSGWYAIPADDPIVNAKAGLKLEFRRENWSIYLSFETLDIQGHTDGNWVYLEMVITQEDFDFYHDLWGGPWPPFPVGVSVLPIRFLTDEFDVDDQSGTIFWDDMRVVQLPTCAADLTGSSNPNSPDYGVPDGVVDADDFFFYIDLFKNRDPRADLTGSADPRDKTYGVCNDVIDANDFFFYLTQFREGC